MSAVGIGTILVSLTWTWLCYQPPLFSSSSLHNDRKQTNKKTPISGERHLRMLSGHSHGFIRSARERRDMPIIQHIPCPTSSNSRLQTKALLWHVCSTSGGDKTRVNCIAFPKATSEAAGGRQGQQSPPASCDKRGAFALLPRSHFYSHCFAGVGGVLL